MNLIGLTDLLRESADYRRLLDDLKTGVSGNWNVIRSARPYLLATLAADWDGAIIYATGTGRHAYNISEQLPVWLSEPERIFLFAEPTPMFYDRLPWDPTVVRDRIDALQALLFTPDDQAQPIVVTSARALMQRTMPVHLFRQRSTVLKRGQTYTFDYLIDQWMKLGYEPVTMVSEPGTFTRRGGILDIFPLAADLPLRLEFFGDELDTLRTFNPATQRTVASVTSAAIVPAREVLPEQMPQVAAHLAEWFKRAGTDDDVLSLLQDYEAMQNGQNFAYLEHYLPYCGDLPVSLLDYATSDTLIVVDDLDDFAQTVMHLQDEADTNRENNLKTGQIAEDFPLPYVAWDVLSADLDDKTTLDLSSMSDGLRLFHPGERYGGQLRNATRQLREQRDAGQRVVLVTQQGERFKSVWYEQDASGFIPEQEELTGLPEAGTLVVVPGELSGGFTLMTDDRTLNLVTDAELFGWQRPEPRRRKSARRGAQKLPETDYADWHEGDYVVHVDYGIGRFSGLRTRTVEGNEREYLLVEYDKNGMLFVPIHQADRLTRYVGADESPPKLNALGKQDVWIRTKEKARKNAAEEARELLKIYAKRSRAKGFSYSPDGAWQHELEASFPYVETLDQLRVISEVKRDMESSMPMDRLVCGDVGYGKTEVALRAAFKAITDGKQVAILVPTTVLANQHYHTFQMRMEPFPIKVAMLSRFRTKAEQNRTTMEIANGTVDVVIGTHRILSDDVTFQNLGLVIIDEEQRFGVKHKEHFKKLRANVDVLTLTATPIPRTLYMSLSGVRDISMLQTPPEDRLPVITHVGGFDARLVRQAILRELDRGGQVFVIHNRVKSIEHLREKLMEIVPEASIVVAHGQMSGRQLENIISAFGHGEYDILLATSIIENGIDMPNVNTLIVDRADWFGMGQLYQIRGRVGRGATQAYAYFFHAGAKRLTLEARERLETLAEYTDLGSGFQISVRDLELRGAGDILSTRQTGHVATVGLQLYTQLLQQAVSELKGAMDGEPVTQQSHEQERIVIDLPVAAYIPDDWIQEMALRLQLYRRIGGLQTLNDIDAMQAELQDRFGVLPVAVDGLLYQIRVKLMAAKIKATAVIRPREELLIKLPWLPTMDRDALALALGEDVEVSRTAVELRFDPELWRLRLMDILEQLQSLMPEHVGV